MDTKAITGLFCALAGSALLLFALFRASLPRQKRWILAYMAVCFYVYGALEYFGVIRLESHSFRMTAFDWIRIAGGLAGLWLAFVERRKQPERKTWILLLIASIGFIVTGIFSI